jgi:hypothetical protein
LKDDKHNDQWHRKLASIARAQDMSDILNHNYKPATPTEIALFDKKQKFMYAVLEAKVETAKGKSILHTYEALYDAQNAYTDIKDYHLTSNSALFGANKIVEYLTSARINDGSWHGSMENFIIHWQNQFRLYECLVPAASHYKDKQKLAMLQVAVHPIWELRHVKIMALLLKQANRGKDITYNEYIQLLSHAASDYNNSQIGMKGKGQVYQSNLLYEEDNNNYETSNNYEPYDIDTPVETIQAYATNYRTNFNTGDNNNRVRIPKDRWMSLDDKTRAIWDSIDDKFKNIILGYTSSTPSNPSISTRSG